MSFNLVGKAVKKLRLPKLINLFINFLAPFIFKLSFKLHICYCALPVLVISVTVVD